MKGLFLVSLLLVLCTVPAAAYIKIRFFHAAPNPTPFGLDVFLNANSTPIFTKVQFRTASSYVDVSRAGRHNIKVVRSGDSFTTASPGISLTFEDNKAYTIIGYGVSQYDFDGFQFRAIVDQGALDAPSGQSNFNFVNLVPDLGSISLLRGTEVVANSISYTGSSNYSSVPSGQVSFSLFDKAVVLSGYYNLEVQQSYTVFAIGQRYSLYGDKNLQLSVIKNDFVFLITAPPVTATPSLGVSSQIFSQFLLLVISLSLFFLY
eukprot:TRINITY_DN3478_c0_g1_i1.p1 TRINITY_DN3478_c0_g1~~TRINITY_DN3478_c0_g1_i1.p1  ORF type:complete len:297 (-),score=78.08 TRINITY_DN3478_c0_g1_i1:67-852(-)